MTKKKKKKKLFTDGGHKIPDWMGEIKKQIPNTMSADLFFSYPVELRERLEGISNIEFILQDFEREAREFLSAAGLDTEISHLIYDDDCDIGYPEASAREILFLAGEVRSSIEDGDAEQVAIRMLRLMSAVFRMRFFDDVIINYEAQTGRIKNKGKDKQKKGISAAVKKFLKENPKYSAMRIWNNLKHYTVDWPLKIAGFNLYIDGEQLYQTLDDEVTQSDPSPITLKTFRQNYVAPLKEKLNLK